MLPQKSLLQSRIIKFTLILFLSLCFSFAIHSKSIHQPYSKLLSKYVQNGHVNYSKWKSNQNDILLLKNYIENLENQKPSKMQRAESLAFYLNAYNALTLNLILDNYPTKSIKDTSSWFSSPWKKNITIIEGHKLTLNEIENDIIRPKYKDARIHFALNCAAVSCPPLFNKAFEAKQLNKQLNFVTKNALSKSGWLSVKSNVIYLTKIMSWYKTDFVYNAGSLKAFILRYRNDLKSDLKTKHIEFINYNWKLNE